FLYKMLTPLKETLGETFDELNSQHNLIEKVILEEEQSFLRTLDKGIQRFETYCKGKPSIVAGDFAFELYDTFGFPIDLTNLLAEEKGLKVDMPAFEAELKQQKDRSREATKVDTGDWVEVFKDDREEFIGYDQTEAQVKISRYRKVKQKNKELYQLVFNLTPFYPEGGGQVGDTGYIEANGEKVSILDTKKENHLIVHFADQLPANLEADFTAHVSENKRLRTAANHSATHLLHQALRAVLGEHVEQKGSLVHPDYLRFDFSHFQKVSREELRAIEDFVNAKIRANLSLNEERNIPIDEAKAKGALALFGEKYGDTVRLIQFGESVELCGGTHVPATGSIGSFKIISEGAVASGIRRIEAVSGEEAHQLFFEQSDLLAELKAQLKNPKKIDQAIQTLLQENQKLQKEIEQFKAEAAGNVKGDLLKKVEKQGDVNVLIEEVDLDASSVKKIAFQLKAEVENLFLVLASKAGGKPTISVLISDHLVKEKDWNAGQIVRDLAKHIQGGGGGQPFFATAGGKKADGLNEALKAARMIVE
ncbi:MAG: alanine--tRNA ligase, partial [Vicingaceae bacterium]